MLARMPIRLICFFPLALAFICAMQCRAAGTVLPACEKTDFLADAQRFELAELALSPVSATQAGYHEHNGKSLDTELDDSSADSRAANRALLMSAKKCFAFYKGLPAEDPPRNRNSKKLARRCIASRCPSINSGFRPKPAPAIFTRTR